eukprot:gene8620-9646_t
MGLQDVETTKLTKGLLWQLDKKFVSLLCVGYLFALMDRSNLGAVKQPLSDALGLDEEGYALASGIFFVFYLILEVPANIMIQKYGVRKVISSMMILFGILGASQAAATDLNTIVAIRLLLGAAEAGIYPGIAFFLTKWYKPAERGQRFGYLLAMSPTSAVLGGLFAYGVVPLENMASVPALSGWQVLLIAEGLPAVLMGILTAIYLPDQPETAHAWLSKEEQAHAIKRSTHSTSHTFEWSSLKRLGYSLADANLLTVPSNFVTLLTLVAVMRRSDKTGLRAPYAMVAQCISAIGYCMIFMGDASGYGGVSYSGLIVATAAANANLPLITTHLTDSLKGDGNIAMYTACYATIGNMGGIIGPQIYGAIGEGMPERNGAPDYRYAHVTMSCVALVGALLMAYSSWEHHGNPRTDVFFSAARKKPTPNDAEDAPLLAAEQRGT